MAPGRKFSSTTSAEASSRRRIAWPSGAFMLSVRLFLLRFTERKYVASPLTKGGQPRVSSPLPGSSILMTSAPMSPSDMAQKGPARTRVRSITRMPDSGPRARGREGRRALPTRDVRLAVFTSFPFHEAFDEALADGGALLAAVPRAPPEQTRPCRESHGREVEDRVHVLDRHARADLDAARLLPVAEEAGAPFQLDDRDVKRRSKAFGWRVK